MPEYLRDLWRGERLRTLLARANRGDARAAERYGILTASGPNPTGPQAEVVARQRARRAAWEAYLSAGFAFGMFDGAHGADLLARMKSVDDDQFRAGMAECMAAWLLAKKVGGEIKPFPRGRRGRNLDLRLVREDGDLEIEVKAPRRDHHPTRTEHGNDADLLTANLRNANRKFHQDQRNLLFLHTRLRNSVFWQPGQVVDAYFGREAIVTTMNMETGEPVGRTVIRRILNWAFLRRMNQGELPAHTRIGAVVLVEERPVRCHGTEEWVVEHDLMVVHNPFARRQLPEGLWGNARQFVPRDGQMLWEGGPE